jgi:hypothetical protein
MANWMGRVGTLVLATGAVLGLAAVAPLEAQSTSSAAASKKPNIVFIFTDNLGYGELGVYGGGILRGAPTPRIDNSPAKARGCSTSMLKHSARRPVPHL